MRGVDTTVHLPAKPARALAGMFAAGMLAALAACGSSSASADASSTAPFGTTMQQQCTAVAGVLSDGPDPSADPVGYAEAQILPLRQLELTDKPLHQAVQSLASAYQEYYSAGTGKANTAAAVRVSKAEAAVNAICPGAAN
jgi:hypothetical protein